ncbi:hypothetical protein B0H13DRAFT_1881703 [Mycena leptocephala]|nr:hypothetical protein B0H13DRAFT_1881703 [Mycena leptocephala]
MIGKLRRIVNSSSLDSATSDGAKANRHLDEPRQQDCKCTVILTAKKALRPIATPIARTRGARHAVNDRELYDFRTAPPSCLSCSDMALLRSTRATAFRKAFKLTLAHSDNYNGTGCKFTVTLTLNSKKALRMMPILSRREMSVYQRFICGDRLVSEAVQTLFPAPHWVPAGILGWLRTSEPGICSSLSPYPKEHPKDDDGTLITVAAICRWLSEASWWNRWTSEAVQTASVLSAALSTYPTCLNLALLLSTSSMRTSFKELF